MVYSHIHTKTWTNQLQKLNFHDLLKLNGQIYYADMHWLTETSFSVKKKKDSILTYNQTQNNEQSAFWMTALIWKLTIGRLQFEFHCYNAIKKCIQNYQNLFYY